MASAASLILSLALAAAAPAPDAAEVERVMWAYTKAWNRHDAPTIARDFYRTGPDLQTRTANLTRGFQQLRAQGYVRSTIHEIKACLTGPDTAWAGMRFSRLTATGDALPPRERATNYELRRFPEGWRITRLSGGDAAQPLACPTRG